MEIHATKPRADKRETLVYLQSMTHELSKMARRRGLKMVGYFLDMAYFEICEEIGRCAEVTDRARSEVVHR